MPYIMFAVFVSMQPTENTDLCNQEMNVKGQGATSLIFIGGRGGGRGEGL